MSENFAVTYMAGGKVDKLPHPLFPKKSKPHILGRKVSIPASVGVYTDTIITDVDSEYLCIAIAASVYTIGDYWELSVGGRKVCESIYMKGLPESIAVGNTMVVIYPIPAQTTITFTYNNSFNIEKQVFYNLHFLE